MEKIKGFWVLETSGVFWVGCDEKILKKDCKNKEEALDFISKRTSKRPLHIREFRETVSPIFIPTFWHKP